MDRESREVLTSGRDRPVNFIHSFANEILVDRCEGRGREKRRSRHGRRVRIVNDQVATPIDVLSELLRKQAPAQETDVFAIRQALNDRLCKRQPA